MQVRRYLHAIKKHFVKHDEHPYWLNMDELGFYAEAAGFTVTIYKPDGKPDSNRDRILSVAWTNRLADGLRKRAFVLRSHHYERPA